MPDHGGAALTPSRESADDATMARAGDGIAARVLGSSSSGIVNVDLDGRIVLLNAGAQRLLGCSERSIRAALGWDPEAP